MSDSSAPRLIAGNLDVEDELAGVASGTAAARTASEAATLLRAFARDGDHLWTPRPIAWGRMAPLPGVPRPVLTSGPLAAAVRRIEPGAALVWGAAGSAARALRAIPAAGGDARDRPFHETAWQLPRPPIDVAERVCSRRFALDAALRLDCALPGARIVETIEELNEHLRRGGSAASRDRRFVLKALYSAAGRHRWIAPAPSAGPTAAATAHDEPRVARLLARHRALLFEPWMERVDDYGACGWVTATGRHLLGFHRMDVDPNGAFRAIHLGGGGATPGLDGAAAEELARTFHAVAGLLTTAGYTGPFGLDAWSYRDIQGCVRLNPLGEINARLTFGHVARALRERLAGAGAADGAFRLVLAGGNAAAGARILPLFLPEDSEEPSSWLELPLE